MSRAGRVATGVDRVELAWLRRLLDEPAPLFLVARTGPGYVLLDRAGARAVLGAVETGRWGPAGWLARLSRRLPPAVQAAQTFVRARAVGRALPPFLPHLLRRHLPAGTAYVNVGHSNLTDRMLGALRRLPGARITVLVHDTIPLDHPDLQRPGTAAGFAAKLARACRHADAILVTSPGVAADLARHFSTLPPVHVAPLGLDLAPPDPAALPPLDLTRPYFVALGTIEPRKNIGLLLDVWQNLGPNPPQLFLCGARGWRNEAVFARLDRGLPGVRELPGLPDAAVAALLAGARALLFPSVAEGYGLPPLEAAARGVPVICADLPVCRDLLGNAAVYRPSQDVYQWQQIIKEWSLTASDTGKIRFEPPTWDQHFKIALRVT
jgi:glycosyltransferase involved in cell wall biosynthesis